MIRQFSYSTILYCDDSTVLYCDDSTVLISDSFILRWFSGPTILISDNSKVWQFYSQIIVSSEKANDKCQTDFVCSFGIFRPSHEFSTHMETSPLLFKGCKFWPMLGTYNHGYWAVMILWLATGLPWNGTSVYNGHISEDPWPSHIYTERLGVKPSLSVLMT